MRERGLWGGNLFKPEWVTSPHDGRKPEKEAVEVWGLAGFGAQVVIHDPEHGYIAARLKGREAIAFAHEVIRMVTEEDAE